MYIPCKIFATSLCTSCTAVHPHLILVVDNHALLHQIVVVLHGTIEGGDRFLSLTPSQHAHIEVVGSLSKHEASLVLLTQSSALLHGLRKETGLDYDGEFRGERNTLRLARHEQSAPSTPNGVGDRLTITEHFRCQIAKTHCQIQHALLEREINE